MEEYTLYNGTKIPKIAYGTLCYSIEEAEKYTYDAIKAGYRLIDTAQSYKNEEGVGIAVNKAINEGICTREELFITTKLNPYKCLGYENTIKFTEESLKKLNLDYIDLLLIHVPRVTPDDRWKEINAQTWRAMEDLVKQGKVKTIGVSNFMIYHIEELLKTAQIKPFINQIEFSPMWQQRDVVDFCKKNNILIEGYYIMGKGQHAKNPVIKSIAAKYHKDPAQIILRYCIQNNVLPLTKTTHEDRLKTNKEIFDFDISDEDMQALNSLHSNPSGTPPDGFYAEWQQHDYLLEQHNQLKRRSIRLFNLFTIFRTKAIDNKTTILYLLNFIPIGKIVKIDRYNSKFLLGGSICLFSIRYSYKTEDIIIEDRLLAEYK